MTVATGIELGNATPLGSAGNGIAGQAGFASGSDVATATSFRSNWQAVVAALHGAGSGDADSAAGETAGSLTGVTKPLKDGGTGEAVTPAVAALLRQSHRRAALTRSFADNAVVAMSQERTRGGMRTASLIGEEPATVSQFKCGKVEDTDALVPAMVAFAPVIDPAAITVPIQVTGLTEPVMTASAKNEAEDEGAAAAAVSMALPNAVIPRHGLVRVKSDAQGTNGGSALDRPAFDALEGLTGWETKAGNEDVEAAGRTSSNIGGGFMQTPSHDKHEARSLRVGETAATPEKGWFANRTPVGVAASAESKFLADGSPSSIAPAYESESRLRERAEDATSPAFIPEATVAPADTPRSDRLSEKGLTAAAGDAADPNAASTQKIVSRAHSHSDQIGRATARADVHEGSNASVMKSAAASNAWGSAPADAPPSHRLSERVLMSTAGDAGEPNAASTKKIVSAAHSHSDQIGRSTARADVHEGGNASVAMSAAASNAWGSAPAKTSPDEAQTVATDGASVGHTMSHVQAVPVDEKNSNRDSIAGVQTAAVLAASGNNGAIASPAMDEDAVTKAVARSVRIEAVSPVARSRPSQSGRSATGLKDGASQEVASFKGAILHESISSIGGANKTEHVGFVPDVIQDSASTILLAGSGHSSSSHNVRVATRLTDQDAFTALDAEIGSPAATWIQASARHAEAGFRDPELGWVGVRAQAVGGGVHAAVVPGSSDAAQVLGGHLSGLNAYMAEHHGQASTITMAAPEASRTDRASGQEPNMNYESGRQQGNADRQQSHAADDRGRPGAEVARGRDISLNVSETAAPMIGPASVSTGNASHISVIA